MLPVIRQQRYTGVVQKEETAAVFWQGKRLAEGEGKTKKQAEQAAALEALRAIQD